MSGPIYLGGISYSGKTQLRLLLSNHPEIIITRRTYLWKKVYRKFGDLSQQENFEKCLAAILAMKHVQSLHPDPERIRREFSDGEASYSRLFALIHQHHAESLGKSLWGIQIGSVEKDAALLFAQEPDARIIHVVRNPFDRIAESLALSSRKKLSLGLEANSWRESARLARTNTERYPDRYLIVRWEDLLSAPAHTLDTICQFLGINDHPGMLQLDELESLGLATSKGADEEQIQLQKVDRTRPYRLTPADRAFIEAYLKPEMAYFRYECRMSEARTSYGVDYPVYMLGTVIGKPLKIFQKINQNLPF